VDRADIVKEGLHLAGVLASQKMLTAPKALGRDSIDVKLIEDRETLSTILDEAKKFQISGHSTVGTQRPWKIRILFCFWLTQKTRSQRT